jgi:hypothetical protein
MALGPLIIPIQAPTQNFSGVTQWPNLPFPALISAIALVVVACGLVVVASRFDQQSRGFLTISLLLVAAFITATLGSMIYDVKTNPITEILVGALSTAVGAVISQWVGRARYQQHIDPDEHIPPDASPPEQ